MFVNWVWPIFAPVRAAFGDMFRPGAQHLESSPCTAKVLTHYHHDCDFYHCCHFNHLSFCIYPISFRLLHHRALGSRFFRWESKSKYTWDDVLMHELHELTVKTRFTGRDRRRLGGITLPHNPQQVLLWPWSGVDHLLILCFWNFSISIVTCYHMTIESSNCHFRLLLSRTRCFVELMRGEETYSWVPAKIERWHFLMRFLKL